MGKFLKGLSEELSLYVRHTAWLHAVPDRPEGDKSKVDGKPRIATLKEHNVDPELPETGSRYLVDFLFEVGPNGSGFAGPEPISAQEIRAWQEGTGILLSPWEFRQLLALSRSYVSESRVATKRGHPAPWRPEYFEIADQLDAGRRLEESMEREIDL